MNDNGVTSHAPRTGTREAPHGLAGFLTRAARHTRPPGLRIAIQGFRRRTDRVPRRNAWASGFPGPGGSNVERADCSATPPHPRRTLGLNVMSMAESRQ